MNLLTIITVIFLLAFFTHVYAQDFNGNHVEGSGDEEYLRIIDRSFDFFDPNPDLPNISMFYHPAWDTFILGPAWGLWWTQNSYGATFGCLPYLQEPWLTILQNSHDLWYNKQGDGKVVDYYKNIGPDGLLCDAASPHHTFFIQGDLCETSPSIGDWFFEGTMAATIMQAELLLIGRDDKAINHYLPKLERSMNLMETRRDAKNNLLLVGAGADLLCPSYGGVKRWDGSVEWAYHTGVLVTYTAALDRVVELEKMVGNEEKAELYASRARLNREAIKQLLTEEGYLCRFMAKDGTKHGVYGQEKYGYFDAICNVDAICHKVVDNDTAVKIYNKIASIPGLRPHSFLINNYPGLDDVYIFYDDPDGTKANRPMGIYTFGQWVNGGAWNTVEARAILAYYRLGKHEDVCNSMKQLLKFADDFQLDAPFTNFGSDIWFKDKLVNITHDDLGGPAATIRGLFIYEYTADSLTLIPRVPPSITYYKQKEPIRWGRKRIYISIDNAGTKIKSINVNGKEIKPSDADRHTFSYSDLPFNAKVHFVMEGGKPNKTNTKPRSKDTKPERDVKLVDFPENLGRPYSILSKVQKELDSEKGYDYEKAFLKKTIDSFDAYRLRASRDAAGRYSHFSPEKRQEILNLYSTAALNMYTGFVNLVNREAQKTERGKKLEQIFQEASKD